jgi:hypothetical protein
MTSLTTTDYSRPILVFATNSVGDYRKGVVHIAAQKYGYTMGQGLCDGIVGNSWPLPTRCAKNIPLAPNDLKKYIDRLIKCAWGYDNLNKNVVFKITSFPSHKTEEVAPMFALAPKNMVLPYKYKPYIVDVEDREWWVA